MLSSARLTQVFVAIADTLAGDFDVDDFLHNLAQHAAGITESPAVGILLTDLGGGLSHFAASSTRATALAQVQLEHTEGPGVECYRSGRAVITADLAASASRWPNLARVAAEMGIAAAHSFPLRLRSEVIGALDVFGASAVRLPPETVLVAQGLADLATIAILQQRALGRAEVRNEQLQVALVSRIVIEQAKGAVARALGVSVDEAFDVLRTQARDQRRPIKAVARSLLEDPAALTALTGPPD